VRVVNGCIVHETASVTSSAVSKPPPAVPKVVGKSNVTIVHCDQPPNIAASSQSKLVGDSYSAETTESLTVSANSASTPVNATKNGIDVQPSVTEPDDELNTSATTPFVATKSPSPVTDGKAHKENSPEKAEMVIPEWRRVTTSKTVPRTAPRPAVHSGLRPSNTPWTKAGSSNDNGRKTTDSTQNVVSTTIYGAQVQPSRVHSSVDGSAVIPKQSSSQIPANKVSVTSSTVNSTEEQPSSFLVQARSMLRPTYRPVTFEVPSTDGDSATSKFVLRSASSSARRNTVATDVEDRNLVEHKPALDGIGSNTTVSASQSHGETFRSYTAPSVGTSSTLPASVKYSSSTSVRDNSRQSSAESSPTSDEVGTAQTSTFDVKPKPRSKSATSVISDSRAVEVEKPEREIKPPSPHPAATSSQESAKRSPVGSKSERDDDAVNPAAAALASLQPAKLRTIGKPVPPPKLTLHEQLMIAIRDAGGCVPTTTSHTMPCHPRSVVASSSAENSTTVLSVSQSASHEPRSSNAAPTDRVSEKPPASSAVTAAKKTSRVIEPPKPTPHEQLMMAIRTAGGVTPRKSADSDGSRDSTAALSSSSLTSTVDERAGASTEEPPVGLLQASRDSRSTYVHDSSEPSTDKHAPASRGPPPPLPPPTLSPTSTVVEVPKAAAQKPSPAARSRATRQPQPVDAREALLAAIVDAAGGKGLRKVTTNIVFWGS